MKRVFGSIKGRLVLWLFAFTSLLLVSVGLFIYYEVRHIVLDAVDRSLFAKAESASAVLRERHDTTNEHNTIQHELAEIIGGYSVRQARHYYKVTMDGKPVALSTSLSDGGFDPAAGLPPASGSGAPEVIYTTAGPDGVPVRVLHRNVAAFGSSFSVFIAESLGESLRMISTFRRFLLFVIPAGILLVCLTGLLIAHRSLRPLKSFSERISLITRRTLGERISSGRETLELAGLADSFNAMLDRLQKAFDSKRLLIADASHELKTPMSVIRAQCDVVLQRERRPQEYVEAIKTVRGVAGSMDRLIKDLLSLARLDSDILPPSSKVIPLATCIQRAVEMVKPLAEKRSIDVETSVEDNLSISGDSDSLTEAFLNIIENGVKYNRENGLLEVSAVRRGQTAVVSVRDTAVGIREEDRERIFDRFYRAEASRDIEGSGLGLSISRAIIEAHGGEIRLESEPGRGSTFVIVLPLSPAAGEPEKLPLSQEPQRR